VDQLRIGVLGTAQITTTALLGSAASVPEVTVAAVAARDQARAEAYAQRHGIPLAYGDYRALLADPEILILDEPANGLDPEGVRWLRRLLRGFAAEGGTVLVSSHMLAETAQTVDSVVIVDHGRLVTQAPLASLTVHSDLEDAFLQLTGRQSAKEAWK
jgi:ABC-2 type transport system ATP-binding protein